MTQRGDLDRRLSLEDFTTYLAQELEIDPHVLQHETSFVVDLDFDSVQMLELCIVIEELGVELSDDHLEQLDTLAGAYDGYCASLSDQQRDA